MMRTRINSCLMNVSGTFIDFLTFAVPVLLTFMLHVRNYLQILLVGRSLVKAGPSLFKQIRKNLRRNPCLKTGYSFDSSRFSHFDVCQRANIVGRKVVAHIGINQ